MSKRRVSAVCSRVSNATPTPTRNPRPQSPVNVQTPTRNPRTQSPASFPYASPCRVSACCLSAAIVRHRPKTSRNPRTLSPADATPTSYPQTQSPVSFHDRPGTSLQPWSPCLGCKTFHFDFSLASKLYLDSPSPPSLRKVEINDRIVDTLLRGPLHHLVLEETSFSTCLSGTSKVQDSSLQTLNLALPPHVLPSGAWEHRESDPCPVHLQFA